MDDWRAALLADMESLAKDFGRLFLSDCKCIARTERTYWPSRYPEPRARYEALEPRGPWEIRRGGCGLEVGPQWVQSVEDSEAAGLFYDPSGQPVVNSVGQSMIVAPGWHEINEIWMAGPGSMRAAETIHRASELVSGRYLRPILSAVGPPRRDCGVTARAMVWPSIVNLVADVAGRSVLPPADWYVATDRNQALSLEVWRRRDEWGLGEPIIDPEIAEGIGDEPEKIYADRPAFLRDSELALEYLIERLREAREPEAGVGNVTPGDGLDRDTKTFTWGGVPYERLTEKIMDILDVIFEAHRKGRDGVSFYEIQKRVPGNYDGGFYKAFRVKRGGRKVDHPVKAIIEGHGYYRLSDPRKTKVPGKVPERSPG